VPYRPEAPTISILAVLPFVLYCAPYPPLSHLQTGRSKSFGIFFCPLTCRTSYLPPRCWSFFAGRLLSAEGPRRAFGPDLTLIAPFFRAWDLPLRRCTYVQTALLRSLKPGTVVFAPGHPEDNSRSFHCRPCATSGPALATVRRGPPRTIQLPPCNKPRLFSATFSWHGQGNSQRLHCDNGRPRCGDYSIKETLPNTC